MNSKKFYVLGTTPTTTIELFKIKHSPTSVAIASPFMARAFELSNLHVTYHPPKKMPTSIIHLSGPKTDEKIYVNPRLSLIELPATGMFLKDIDNKKFLKRSFHSKVELELPTEPVCVTGYFFVGSPALLKARFKEFIGNNQAQAFIKYPNGFGTARPKDKYKYYEIIFEDEDKITVGSIICIITQPKNVKHTNKPWPTKYQYVVYDDKDNVIRGET